MGKTFVATAIARRYTRPLVVAPAALSEMWTHALCATEMKADFVSFEKLSRLRSKPSGEYDLVIIDEAHHVRNQATQRYSRLKNYPAGRSFFFSRPHPSTIAVKICQCCLRSSSDRERMH
jgi:superfamily II DNA or RNA helicase